MSATPLANLLPRNVWDICDDALDLYRARFIPLCGLAAMFMGGPFVLFLALIKTPVGQIIQSIQSSAPPASSMAAGWNLVGICLLVAPLFWVARSLMDGSVAIVVGEYINSGEEISIAQALRASLRKALPLLGSSFLIALAISLASLITGLLAWLPMTLWAFSGPAIMLENKGAIGSLGRSNSLISGNFGKTLGLILIMQSFPSFLAMALGTVFFTTLSLIPAGGDPVSDATTRTLVGFLLLAFATFLLLPLEAVARVLLYFDLRVRREGLDIVAQAIGQDLPLMDDPFGDISSEEARQRQLRAARDADENDVWRCHRFRRDAVHGFRRPRPERCPRFASHFDGRVSAIADGLPTLGHKTALSRRSRDAAAAI